MKKRESVDTNYTDMHVSELYEIVDSERSDASEAMTEIINRQQSGRALRFYPSGRSSPYTDGAIGFLIYAENGVIVARSGQPNKLLTVSKEVLLRWLTVLPQCVRTAVRAYTSDSNEMQKGIDAVKAQATPNFNFIMAPSGEEDFVSVVFLPPGMPEWRLSVLDCAQLVRAVHEVCEERGWHRKLTAEESKGLGAMISYANSYAPKPENN